MGTKIDASTRDTPQTYAMMAVDKCSIFPFFSLAAELRDVIYDAAGEGQDDQRCNSDQPNLKATGLAITNLLLVSRQFREAYAARAAANSRLSILDHGELELPARPDSPRLPTGPSAIKVVSIHLACFNEHEDWGELDYLHSWTERIVKQLHKLDTLEVHLRLSAAIDNEAVVQKMGGPAWTGFHKLQRIVLWSREGAKKEDRDEEDSGKEQVVFDPHSKRHKFFAIWDATNSQFELVQSKSSAGC
ncbi:hypothetical protein Slin14017_G038960 [Septoria linicola]|nr:hypothetical protein Slin14017_G038960 [Septoria linicola]